MCGALAVLIQKIFRLYPGLYDGFVFIQDALFAAPSLALPCGPRALSHQPSQAPGRRTGQEWCVLWWKEPSPQALCGASLNSSVAKMEAGMASFSIEAMYHNQSWFYWLSQ